MCLILITNSATVSAASATPILGHKYEQGVGNLLVWLDYSTGVGYWENYIITGINNWNSPGWTNKVNLTAVSSNVGSDIDFYRKSDSFWTSLGYYGVLAETKFFKAGTIEVIPSSENWKWANIYINHDAFIEPSFTNEQARSTVIHEMGHAFELDHNNTNPNNVMCQTAYGRIAQRVQKVDNDALNRIYP